MCRSGVLRRLHRILRHALAIFVQDTEIALGIRATPCSASGFQACHAAVYSPLR